VPVPPDRRESSTCVDAETFGFERVLGWPVRSISIHWGAIRRLRCEVTSTTTTSPSTTASTLDETDQTIVSASPVVLRAGEPIVLTFRPTDRVRGGHLLFYGAGDSPDTVRPLFVLQAVSVGASDPGNADDLRGLAPGAYYVVPADGRIDPDGDQVFMPEDLEPGDYKLCNSIPRRPCVALTIVE